LKEKFLYLRENQKAIQKELVFGASAQKQLSHNHEK